MMDIPFEKRILHKTNPKTFKIDLDDVLKPEESNDNTIKRCHMKHIDTLFTLDEFSSHTFQRNDMVVKLNQFYDLKAVGWKDLTITCGCIPRFKTPLINPFMFIRYKRSMIKDYDEFVKRVHEIFYKINVLSICRVYFTYEIDKDFNEKKLEYVCIYVIFDSYSFLHLADSKIFIETFILLHMTELKDFEILDIYDFIDVNTEITKYKNIENDSENENNEKKTVVKSGPKRYSCWVKYPIPYTINSVNVCMEYIRKHREYDEFNQKNMVDPESKPCINRLEDVKFYTAKLLDIDNPGQFTTKLKHDDLINRNYYGIYEEYQNRSACNFITFSSLIKSGLLNIFKPLTYSTINTTKNTFSDKINPTYDITNYII